MSEPITCIKKPEAAAHTPGPWWQHLDSEGSWEVLTHRDMDDVNKKWSPHGASICHCIGDHTESRTRGNERENAYLIAAAPDLLSQAEKCLSWMITERDCYYEGCASRGSGYVHDPGDRETLDLYDKDIDELRAVIAAAKGEL